MIEPNIENLEKLPYIPEDFFNEQIEFMKFHDEIMIGQSSTASILATIDSDLDQI